jgi:N-acetylmuramoyl-L-alanine amidase
MVQIAPAFASIASDFKQVQSSILKIVKIKEQEKLQNKFDDTRSKQQSYKSRFQKPTQVKKISTKDNSQLSLLSIIAGLSGLMKALFALVGIAGLFSIIKKSGIGPYIFEFVKSSLSSIVDLVKKTISFVTDVFSDSNVQRSIYDLAVAFFKFLGTLIVAAATLAISLLRDSEVLETLKNVVVAVFKAVVEGMKASYGIISKLVMDNWETIKQTTFDVFVEIKNALILSLQTLGSIFAGGIDPRISGGLKEIFVAAWSFITEVFTTEFKDPETGKSFTLAKEGFLWVAKMGALAAAWTVFAFYLREKGKQLMGMSFQDLKNSACDCMDLDLPDKDGKKKGPWTDKDGKWRDERGRYTKAPPEEKSLYRKGADYVGEKTTQVKKFVSEKAKAIAEAFEKGFNAVKGKIDKLADKLIRYMKAFFNKKVWNKLMIGFEKRFGKEAAKRVGVKLGALMAGGAIPGLNVLLAALAAYDIYCLYDVMFVSSDGENEDGGVYALMKSEIEAYLKEDTKATPAAAPVVAPTTAPAPVTKTSSTTTTKTSSTSSPAAAPSTTKTSSASSSAAMPTPVSAPAPAPPASSSPTAPATPMTAPTSASMPNVPANIESRKVEGLGFGGPRRSTKGVIIHHTGGRGLDIAIKTLQSRKLSYHYLVDRDGRIVNVLPDNLVGWHAGHTNKKPELNNSNTISISMVAKDDTDVTPEQLAAASSLEEQLAKKYGFPKSESYGHGEVSSGKHPKEGFTIATAIRGGKEASVIKTMAANAVEDIKGAAGTVGPAISQASQTGGQLLDAASNQLSSGLRLLEDLFMKGRPSFTDLSTVINQNNTFSRPGGDLREREMKAIKFLIERQTT